MESNPVSCAHRRTSETNTRQNWLHLKVQWNSHPKRVAWRSLLPRGEIARGKRNENKARWKQIELHLSRDQTYWASETLEGSQVNSLIHKSLALLALEYTYFIPIRLSMFRLSGSWDAHNTSFRYLCYFACSSNPWLLILVTISIICRFIQLYLI